MKKTALEWYAEQAMRLEIEKAKGNISMNEMLNQLSNVLDQSKEMEKDQIKRFALSLIVEITQKYKCDLSEMNFTKNFDDYYKRYQDI